MKKKLSVVWTLAALMLVLCAACGGSENAPAEAEMTPLVLATAEPVQVEAAAMVTAQPRTEAQVGTDAEAEYTCEQERIANEDMAGATVEELIQVIGPPVAWGEYGASCNIEGNDDGSLIYESFTVSTTRYPDGTELVLGAYH